MFTSIHAILATKTPNQTPHSVPEEKAVNMVSVNVCFVFLVLASWMVLHGKIALLLYSLFQKMVFGVNGELQKKENILSLALFTLEYG